jgi:hypothetical protein
MFDAESEWHGHNVVSWSQSGQFRSLTRETLFVVPFICHVRSSNGWRQNVRSVRRWPSECVISRIPHQSSRLITSIETTSWDRKSLNGQLQLRSEPINSPFAWAGEISGWCDRNELRSLRSDIWFEMISLLLNTLGQRSRVVLKEVVKWVKYPRRLSGIIAGDAQRNKLLFHWNQIGDEQKSIEES